MTDDIRCRGGLNIVRDSEVTCGNVIQVFFIKKKETNHEKKCKKK